jgi:predicted transposase/invertase (TIGR01784 family)
MTDINNPHDKLFKLSMEQPEIRRDFFYFNLPQDIREVINLDSIELEDGSFVDEQYNNFTTDMLFSVDLKGEKGFLYLLMEHQTKSDALMPFRLFEYMTKIWRKYLKEHSNSKTLPIIYPMVFYTGSAKWQYPREFWQLFVNQDMAKRILIEPFRLLEVNTLDKDEILKHKAAAIMELFMSDIDGDNLSDILPLLRKIFESIATRDFGYIRALIRYTISEKDCIDPQKMINSYIEVFPEHRGEIMSIAERLRKEGEELGKAYGLKLGEERGKLEGRLEGKLEGKLEAARNMLKKGLDVKIISEFLELPIDTIKLLMDEEN